MNFKRLKLSEELKNVRQIQKVSQWMIERAEGLEREIDLLHERMQEMKDEWEKIDAHEVVTEEKLERLISLIYKPIKSED